MKSDAFFWWSVVSTLVNVLLAGFGIWQITLVQAERKHRQDQIKIWMHSANGLQESLKRIVGDNLDGRYSSTNDIANAIWALHSGVFGMYQSLYEERAISEEDYKKEQKELRTQVRKGTQNLTDGLEKTTSSDKKA